MLPEFNPEGIRPRDVIAAALDASGDPVSSVYRERLHQFSIRDFVAGAREVLKERGKRVNGYTTSDLGALPTIYQALIDASQEPGVMDGVCPDFFKALGLDANVFSTGQYGNVDLRGSTDLTTLYDRVPSGAVEQNIRTKVNFGKVIIKDPAGIRHWGQITSDYDVVGEAITIPEPHRDAYRQIGRDQMEAFKTILANHGTVKVCMDMISQNEPNTRQLLRTRVNNNGVKVWQRTNKERFIVIDRAFLTSNWNDVLGNVTKDLTLDMFHNRMGGDSVLSEDKARDILRKGVRPTTYIAELIAAGFNCPQLLEKHRDSILFNTEYFGDHYVATHPQVHRRYTGMLIKDYSALGREMHTSLGQQTERTEIREEDLGPAPMDAPA